MRKGKRNSCQEKATAACALKSRGPSTLRKKMVQTCLLVTRQHGKTVFMRFHFATTWPEDLVHPGLNTFLSGWPFCALSSGRYFGRCTRSMKNCRLSSWSLRTTTSARQHQCSTSINDGANWNMERQVCPVERREGRALSGREIQQHGGRERERESETSMSHPIASISEAISCCGVKVAHLS